MVGILLIKPLKTHLSGIWIHIQQISHKKTNLKMSLENGDMDIIRVFG